MVYASALREALLLKASGDWSSADCTSLMSTSQKMRGELNATWMGKKESAPPGAEAVNSTVAEELLPSMIGMLHTSTPSRLLCAASPAATLRSDGGDASGMQ